MCLTWHKIFNRCQIIKMQATNGEFSPDPCFPLCTTDSGTFLVIHPLHICMFSIFEVYICDIWYSCIRSHLAEAWARMCENGLLWRGPLQRVWSILIVIIIIHFALPVACVAPSCTATSLNAFQTTTTMTSLERPGKYNSSAQTDKILAFMSHDVDCHFQPSWNWKLASKLSYQCYHSLNPPLMTSLRWNSSH